MPEGVSPGSAVQRSGISGSDVAIRASNRSSYPVIDPPPVPLGRRCFAEFLGTALLVAAVIGSGIMAERLAGGNAAIALLCNTIATAGALFTLISVFGPVSGAHFNPVVTLAEAVRDERTWNELPGYIAAQIVGGISGAGLANAMFSLALVSWSHHVRSGSAPLLSELVATGGLIMTIFMGLRFCKERVPQLVAAYIASAYWFTASTSFANPAVTIARMFSDSFAGIRPADVPGFVLAEILGAAIGLFCISRLAAPLIVPHAAAPATLSAEIERSRVAS